MNPQFLSRRGELNLDPGETIVHAANNGTFHRSFDFEVAVSDRALYLYLWSWTHPFRQRWKRLPFTEIERVEVKPYSRGVLRVTILSALFIAVVVWVHAVAHVYWAVTVAILLAYIWRGSLKSLVDRTLLVVLTAKGKTQYVSPPEDAKMKVSDRSFLLETATVLEQHGVSVVDHCTNAAQPCAPPEPPSAAR